MLNGIAAIACAHPASPKAPTLPTHAKNLSPRPPIPISPTARKGQMNLSASLAECHAFPECPSPLTHRGPRGSLKQDKFDNFLPAWKRKSRYEIQKIKSRKEGESISFNLLQVFKNSNEMAETRSLCQMMKLLRQFQAQLLG
jgi:hypothetical protein